MIRSYKVWINEHNVKFYLCPKCNMILFNNGNEKDSKICLICKEVHTFIK